MHWRESNQRSGFGEPGGDSCDQNDDIGDLFGDGGNHHQNGDLSGNGDQNGDDVDVGGRTESS